MVGSDNDESISEEIVSIIYDKDKEYWNNSKLSLDNLSLLGVFSFVTRILQQQLQPSYSHNFVRNLLVAAQLQEQYIKEIEEKQKSQIMTTDSRHSLLPTSAANRLHACTTTKRGT